MFKNQLETVQCQVGILINKCNCFYVPSFSSLADVMIHPTFNLVPINGKGYQNKKEQIKDKFKVFYRTYYILFSTLIYK